MNTTCPVCKQKKLLYQPADEIISCTNCRAYQRPFKFHDKLLQWASKRALWGWRIPVIAYFGWLLQQHLTNTMLALGIFKNPLSALNFGIHELGHVLFTPLGDFMRIAGGSLFQCIFPLLWLIGFMQKRFYFAASLCWCWLGLNLFEVAQYAADAQARLLPLSVGPAGIGAQGDDAAYDQAHDWYQLLTRTNHLQDDLLIASGLRIAATVVTAIGLLLATYLLYLMLRYRTLAALKKPTNSTDTAQKSPATNVYPAFPDRIDKLK